MAYETFTVYRHGAPSPIGRVDAQSRAEAVFRLVGGAFGRVDFYALNAADLAAASRMAAERADALKAFDAEFLAPKKP